jgi:hypothetical protein
VTAWYAIKGKYKTCYGQAFQNPVIQEIVRFDGVPVRDGVKGSNHGAMYRLWQSGAKYDVMVAKSMNDTRRMQIKRTCNMNINATATKRGKHEYDPAYKYDYMYKTIITTQICSRRKNIWTLWRRDLMGPWWLWRIQLRDFLSCHWKT